MQLFVPYTVILYEEYTVKHVLTSKKGNEEILNCAFCRMRNTIRSLQ